MISQATEADDRYTHMPAHMLQFARAAWFVVLGLTVALFVVSIPVQIAESQIICNSPVANDCFNLGQLTPQLLQEIEQIGLSLGFYVGYTTIVQVAFPIVFLGVGALIYWRKSDDWMALIVSLTLVVFGLGAFASTTKLLPLAFPTLSLPILLLQFLGNALLVVFVFLFPDGRLVPRWILWLMPLILLREGINSLLPESDIANSGGWFALQLVEVALALYAQIYRYRRVSGPVQRQQTKWVVYGMAMAFIGYFGIILLFGIGFTGWTTNVLAVLFLETALPSFLVLIPLSILVAILRYRLYEIDLLINRTLVYVPLTAILAGIFAASISLTQRLFVALTGQQSDAGTVLTTLIVVAAFDPLKTSLQHLVDRRFKERSDPSKQLKSYGNQVDAIVHILRADESARRLLDEAMKAFEVTSGAVFLMRRGERQLVEHIGVSSDEYVLSVPLVADGTELGYLSLGARKNGMAYSENERAVVRQTANSVAAAIALTEQMDGARR